MTDLRDAAGNPVRWLLRQGDCRDVMAKASENSVDAIVCDPPYGLEFMGKDWDKLGDTRQPFKGETKPGSRPFDRAMVRHGGYTSGAGRIGAPGIGKRATPWVSNTGWNAHRCRSCGKLAHGGSPCKCDNPDFGPADDRWLLMLEWHKSWAVEALRVLKPGGHLLAFGGARTFDVLTFAMRLADFEIRDCLCWLYGTGMNKVGYVKDAQDVWPGVGGSLKPGWEPIVVARKPLAGTLAKNIREWGVGGFGVDGCRLEYFDDSDKASATPQGRDTSKVSAAIGAEPDAGRNLARIEFERPPLLGRWPPNVLLDEDAAALLDASVPPSTSRKGKPRSSAKPGAGWGMTRTGAEYNDSGGPSRFFFCAKASTRERTVGLPERSKHPTHKPVSLMRWLCRLVTPPDGVVLDPFAGSGSTGIACLLEGFKFIGIELTPEYLPIAEARLRHVERYGERWLDEKGGEVA